MLKNKKKSELRASANSLKPIIQIGKDGIGFNSIDTIEKALKAHELIKISVLRSSPLDVNAAAIEISATTGCDVVQVIGHVIVLYKENRKK